MRRIVNRVLFVIALSIGAGAPAAPMTQPAPVFGQPAEGVAISLGVWPQRPPRVGTPLVLRLVIKNDSSVPLPTDNGFAWLLLAADREKAWYSEKLNLAAIKNCPPRIAAGAQAELNLDLTERSAFAMQRGVTIKAGYPTPAEGEPAAAGVFSKLLPEGSFKAKLTVVLPARKEPIASNAMSLLMGPPILSTLAPEKRKALLEGMIAQFNKSAYGGQAAHHRAVLIGPDAVEPILGALGKPGVAAESRMWLTTALIDIGDVRAINTLLKLFAGDGAVRHVIAYHGQKMHDARLDDAIFSAAARGDDATLLEWASRGAAAFGSGVPEKLIPVALVAKDPRVRAEIAQVLVRQPVGKNIERLAALLGDSDMRVRAAVAKAIAAASIKDGKLIAALVGSLDSSDDVARQAICAALGALTSQSHPYHPQADAAEKAKVIAQWKALK